MLNIAAIFLIYLIVIIKQAITIYDMKLAFLVASHNMDPSTNKHQVPLLFLTQRLIYMHHNKNYPHHI
jgi:hypothetical protein